MRKREKAVERQDMGDACAAHARGKMRCGKQFQLVLLLGFLSLAAQSLCCQSVWLKIDENLNALSLQDEMQRALLEDLQRQLQTAQGSLEMYTDALTAERAHSQSLEATLQKRDRSLRRWRTASIVLAAALPVVITITYTATRAVSKR